jgi:hypothetical protein
MDIQTSHLLSKLDLLYKTQRDHGDLLRRILATAEAKTQLEPAGNGQKPLAAGIILRGALMWMLGASIIGYLVNGGDPLRLVEVLLKFFG